ncbi:MAG: hypothetical protein FD179_1388 [Erysipelotrichaceae bacterium]|nr:MAG: hypothetical protein FD179_1388 [Erysipelotrichaceae bacterium]
MYNNVGKLIGYYRRKKYDETKLTNFSQVGFVYYEHRLICAQSKLSIIENGKVRIPYPEEYYYLIKNLDFNSLDYSTIESLYCEFTSQLLHSLQYCPISDLKKLQIVFEQKLEPYSNFFYLHELNEVFKATMNSHLGLALPNVSFLDDYLDALDCFPSSIQFLILDLANLIIENYIPYKEIRDKVNNLVDQLQLDAPIVKILKASRNLRQLKMIDVQQRLKSIDTDHLNELMKFRIQRLLFMIEIEDIEQLSKFSESQNPAIKFTNINRFERCRPYLISGYLRYFLKDYEFALMDYKKALSINPEAVCFSMIYISDCLYELKRTPELHPYLIDAQRYISHFSDLHTDVLKFFNVVSGLQISEDESNQFRSLFESLAQLNSVSPYVRIIRKHLLNYAKKTHKYKLIFDYETMMLDNL